MNEGMTFPQLTEEHKYALWSVYYTIYSKPMEYVEWCESHGI